jgi:hypothetical protein
MTTVAIGAPETSVPADVIETMAPGRICAGRVVTAFITYSLYCPSVPRTTSVLRLDDTTVAPDCVDSLGGACAIAVADQTSRRITTLIDTKRFIASPQSAGDCSPD